MKNLTSIKSDIKAKATSIDAWRLRKEESSCAPDGVNTNKDNDVTPPDRRTWTMLVIAGFWASDYLSQQSVEGAANSIEYGMTWRTSLIISIIGMIIIGLPLVLNGAIGAKLHVPFPVLVRSSFGYHLAKFAVITRCVTAVFWHSTQTFSGSLCMARCIAAIWPQFDKIHNSIPASMGVTSSQMVAHFIFWTIQLPFLLIPPHKLRWFFVMKTIVVSGALIGTAAGMAKLVHGDGDIWDQKYTLHGAARSWEFMTLLNSGIAGWATMATNISDFTRYMKDGSKGQYAQVVVIPLWATFVTMMAIIATSASKLAYGSYLWDPVDFALEWTVRGSKGRAAAFFVSAAWCIAQIGTNLSANVITGANDLTSLFPHYINIRRGSILITIVSGWILQAWKIENSAGQLINFISGLSCFLAPITGIIITDYWLIKKRQIDVPGLYDPFGRYRYYKGFNWRAALAFICGNVPTLPGLAAAVNSNITLVKGMTHLWNMSYFYGFFSASVVYYLSSIIFPVPETLIEETIYYIYDVEDVSTSHSFEEVMVDGSKEKTFE